jgi:two-component system chemotaxis sensor kinase CheA
MLGLTAVRDYVHALETTLKDPPDVWVQAHLDRLFEGAAALRQAVERAGTDAQDESLARLEALSAEAADAVDAPDTPERPGAQPTPAAVPAEAAAPDAAPAATDGAATDAAGGGEILRVPFGKLDALLNQVGELIQAGSALEDLVERNRLALETAGIRRALLERVETLGRVAEALQTAAMDLRLVPVRRVFSRFPSLVRDLAREEAKQVRVVLEGEDTELDKSTVDVLAEPLLHLVRNAVDHGIGTPAEREARGKPPEGTVTLRAIQSGDQVRIEVEDDGAGLDRDAILDRAREVGLVRPGEELTPEEIDELIFRPGFSTRREANTVSGRGIGMDIVQQTVARLRGSLEVEAVAEGGTRFVLRLPLTLAIVPVLIFETAGQMLALPAAEIEETLRNLRPEQVGRTAVLRIRDELVPLAWPARLFGWDGEQDDDGTRARVRFALVVRRGTRATAIAADRLVDQRSVVVKALPSYLGQPRAVSGATIEADGRVVLLLDAGALVDLNLESQRRYTRA